MLFVPKARAVLHAEADILCLTTFSHWVCFRDTRIYQEGMYLGDQEPVKILIQGPAGEGKEAYGAQHADNAG